MEAAVTGVVERSARLLATLLQCHEAGLHGYQMGPEAVRVLKFVRCGLSLAALISKATGRSCALTRGGK